MTEWGGSGQTGTVVADVPEKKRRKGESSNRAGRSQ